MARVIQVIETEITRGDGRETILRGVRQYWSFEGDLLAESDPCPGDKAKVCMGLEGGSTTAAAHAFLNEQTPSS